MPLAPMFVDPMLNPFRGMLGDVESRGLSGPDVETMRAELQRMEQLAQQLAGPAQSHPDLVPRLRELSQPLVHDPAVLDLNLWWTQVALVANRVGFILCDDLELAAATIRNEPALFGTMPASDKVRELVSYSVSPAYFRVRRELGFGVG